MLRKFMTWLIVWEVSFLASKTGLIEQGMAFIYIYVFLDFWYVLAFGENMLRSQEEVKEGGAVARHINWILAFSLVFASIVKVGLTWTVSTVFQIDFYSAYQILVLGSCLFDNKKNE